MNSLVTCEICNLSFKRITHKHLLTHSYTKSTYLEEFPNAIMCSKESSKLMSNWWNSLEAKRVKILTGEALRNYNLVYNKSEAHKVSSSKGGTIGFKKQLHKWTYTTKYEKEIKEELFKLGFIDQKFFSKGYKEGSYVVDFINEEKKLIVEIDGWTHTLFDRIIHDKKRDFWFNRRGFNTIRIKNEEITENKDKVLNKVKNILDTGGVEYSDLIIYIASAFFTPDQLKLVIDIEELLKDIGIKFFSPRLEGKTIKNLPAEERLIEAEKAFSSNLEGLNLCNLLLHVVDDKDQGAAWEQGYWIGHKGFKNIMNPIVTFTNSNKSLNIMFQQPSFSHLHDLNELERFLTMYKKEGLTLACKEYSNFGVNLT